MSYEELKKIHNDGDMNPALLDHKELRRDVMGGNYKMMKNQNLVRNSDAYLLAVEKLIQITTFHELMILISEKKIHFNWGINF